MLTTELVKFLPTISEVGLDWIRGEKRFIFIPFQAFVLEGDRSTRRFKDNSKTVKTPLFTDFQEKLDQCCICSVVTVTSSSGTRGY